jgi:acetylornithine deacetylase
MRETTRILRDLVRLPSVNPMGRPLRGPEVFEHQVTAYLEDFFSTLGTPYQLQFIAPQRSNIVSFFHPPDATSTLLFEVHQDTVPTDHMTIVPFGAHIDQGRLFGRGACDVKGGMAAMLHAFARAVRQPNGRKRLVMACTVDEEHTFLGVQRLVQDDLRGGVSGPIHAIVAEPTQLNIVHAHKGAVRWSLQTTGRSCHSSRPELGVNAIYHMAHLLVLVERYAEQLRQTRSHPLLGPATLSVGRIEGGTSVNTVPDRCSVEIDRRSLPGEDVKTIPADFEAFLHQQHAPAQIAFSCTAPWLNCPALGPENSAELVSRLGRIIDQVRGQHTVHPVPYGTDASTLAEAGIPSVVFGPGNIDQAHTCDEWIDVEEVEVASEILFRLATEL